MSLKNLIRKGIFSAILTALLIFFPAQVSGEDLGGIRSGETKTSGIDFSGDSDSCTFYGNEGDLVVIYAGLEYGSGSLSPHISLYGPGAEKEADDSGYYSALIEHTLLNSGLYTIVIRDDLGPFTGSYGLSLVKAPGAVISPQDRDGSFMISGDSKKGQITLGDLDCFNFYGSAGHYVAIYAGLEYGSGSLSPHISLYGPGGEKEADDSGYYSALIEHTLLNSGLYTIVIRDDLGPFTGSYGLSFTKNPPDLPPGVYNPTPANGALVSHTTNLLDWSDTVGATHYDVYFGTNVTTPLTKIAENITASSCSLSPLLIGTTYYWKVVAKTGSTDILGPVWTFTTEQIKDDLIGTWDGQGVYYRNSDDGSWVKMATAADLIAAGDLDGDGTDDLIGIWAGQGGVWVKYSSTGTWSKLSSTAKDIASGDMNGDGTDDLLGIWDGQGVYYRDSDTGTWVKMASPADLIVAGDLDGDGTDDLCGIWAGQGGVWVKYSSTSTWSKLSSTAKDIASGDMNGDGTDDLLGIWDGQGVYYRDSDTGTWVKMASPADLIVAGDLDGDGTDDLIGIWAGQGGVWVKYSSTGSWSKLSSAARDIDAGKMSGGAWGGGLAGFIKLLAPIGGYAEGPGSLVEYEDLSNKGPGGWNFVFQEEKNLAPKEKESMRIMLIPGPGELGFRCIEQKNLFPQERIEKKKKIRRK